MRSECYSSRSVCLSVRLSTTILALQATRRLEHHQYDASAVEQLRCDLLSLSQSSAFLHILVPSLSHILTDRILSGLPSFPMNEELKAACNAKKASLTVSREERESIEKETRNQSSNIQWHIIRAHRITGSKCGKILSQITKSVSHLVNCLYEKPKAIFLHPLVGGANMSNRCIYCTHEFLRKPWYFR